jgi:hypothetical protein
MPFGLGPTGWAYVSRYAYPYFRAPYPVWSWWGGWRGGWARGRGWRWSRPYWYSWW